jgi:hypothetical protein
LLRGPLNLFHIGRMIPVTLLQGSAGICRRKSILPRQRERDKAALETASFKMAKVAR